MVLVAVTGGLPWLLFALAGSPVPDRLPGWEEIVAALSRRDDGTLLLGFLTYFAWVLWAAWTTLVILEALAQLRRRSAPHIPGLAGPQQLAAILIASVGATVIGTSMSIGRASALPSPSLSSTVDTAPPRHLITANDAPPDEAPTDGRSKTTATQTRLREPMIARAAASGAVDPDLQDTQAPSHQQRHTVRFAFDSAELSPAAEAFLARLAVDIQRDADPQSPIILVGHTDSFGPSDYNQRLSVQRAAVVRKALSQNLGDGFRFKVSGKGETAPLTDETHPDGRDDPDGRARNRCVEITVTLHQLTPPAPPTTQPPTTSGTPSTVPQPPTATPSEAIPSPSSASPSIPASSPAPPAASPSGPPASPSVPDRHQQDPTTVRLPTGALVGLGLAGAISIAIAASRLHRRRRRTPEPDHLTVSDPEPPSAPSIRALRKSHLDSYISADLPIPSDPQLVESDLMAEVPTHLTVGIRDAQPVTVPLCGLNMGFTGPGAIDAARAIATELLARAHRSRIELVIPEDMATSIFDLAGDGLAELGDHVPGLILTAGWDAALRYLETEILHRARMMTDHDVTDVAALREADPAEPLPTIVLLAEVTESERFTAALDAALQLAERYGIGGLLLGQAPAGTTCNVAADGVITHVDGPYASALTDTELFHLPVSDAADLLQVIRTAHGADTSAPTEPVAEPDDQPRTADEQPAQAPALLQPPPPGEEPARPVRIRVLGPIQVEIAEGQITTGLRRISRDLLVFLALHPQGVTREQGVNALWPERDLDSGSTMFHTAINNIRQTLRKATGLREPMFVTHAEGRYRLDSHLIDVDLWHFLHALAEAAHADNDTDRIPALRRLAESYAGELADELTYEWAEAERERIRRTGTDALVRLARILQPDHPDDALAALEQAFDHDLYSEQLAGDLMRLQAQLGQLDGVQRTHRLLSHRLNELDVDPSPETDRLVADLLRQHKGSRRRPVAAPEPTTSSQRHTSESSKSRR